MRKCLVVLVSVVALGLLALPATAQTVVVNPTTIEFTPSPDHGALGLDGTPRVSRYEMRIFVENPLGTTPIQTTDIGKPTPVSNKISVVNPVWFAGLVPNTRFVAKVATIGPAGEGVSGVSNPFGNESTPGPASAVTVKK